MRLKSRMTPHYGLKAPPTCAREKRSASIRPKMRPSLRMTSQCGKRSSTHLHVERPLLYRPRLSSNGQTIILEGLANTEKSDHRQYVLNKSMESLSEERISYRRRVEYWDTVHSNVIM
ncbi:hypothetical protein Hamer_G024753 [Homarus americanus]|uniref:Uncharacterized protein n=1 Tax=Homarus americanus TaxID=6706 RepID=A0A8J5K6I6_HOMAM|nr:hypothetical protein Hamer_G024753 [Homarus americanus]